MVASAWSWPDEGVRAQIPLNVGGYDLSGDAITGHKPLVCPRHGGWRVRGRSDGVKGKRTLMSVPEGPRNTRKWDRAGSRLQTKDNDLS